MNGELGDNDSRDEAEDEDVLVETDEDVSVEIDESDVDLSETAAGINVDEIVAKIEKRHGSEIERKRQIRKQLDEHLHQDDEFGSTYNFNLDEDLN